MLFHTENETTRQVGQAIATVICDSLHKDNRITTVELVYPRYIHSELMTHRMFSRNASSSRATPIRVLVDEVKNDPVFFDHVGVNKSGMMAGDKLNDEALKAFKERWCNLANYVASEIQQMSDDFDIHKQVLNRALEPFSRIRTLVTSTEWDNFFNLRLSPDAQPEMQSLALSILQAMKASEPVERRRHFPYVTSDEYDLDIAPKLCVARCARVSYARLDGKETNHDADVELHERLKAAGHMSPFEHAAYGVGDYLTYDNYRGWMSYRHVLKF